MTTIAELLRSARDESGRRDLEVLLAAASGLSRAYLYAHGDESLTGPVNARMDAMLADYRAGTPVAYITGRRDFWTLSLEVSSDVLIPRPETELLVELALERLPERARVLDLGTGSGALALAIKRERADCTMIATDISGSAIETARRNAGAHAIEVDWRVGDWYSVAGGTYDLIVSNPPYIAENDTHLDSLVSQPMLALVAGPDGLDALQCVIAGAPEHLEPNGWLLVEHGHDQGRAVRRLFEQHRFGEIDTHRDVAQHERVTLGRR